MNRQECPLGTERIRNGQREVYVRWAKPETALEQPQHRRQSTNTNKGHNIGIDENKGRGGGLEKGITPNRGAEQCIATPRSIYVKFEQYK